MVGSVLVVGSVLMTCLLVGFLITIHQNNMYSAEEKLSEVIDLFLIVLAAPVACKHSPARDETLPQQPPEPLQ